MLELEGEFDSISSAMLKFPDFISKHSPIDLPLEGGLSLGLILEQWLCSLGLIGFFSLLLEQHFPNIRQKRLHRLLSDHFPVLLEGGNFRSEEHFPNVHQKRLHRLLSDHFPVLLEGGNFHRSSHHFCFENMWLKAEGFVEKVRVLSFSRFLYISVCQQIESFEARFEEME